ncbi:MAG: AI-2E family transporter [Candidatus Cloacimonetes bacterium]|nr:AI-2E family transporter [Candidatus Cloacimonadota bacterium]
MNSSEKELRLIRMLLTIIAVPMVVMIFRTLKAIFIPLMLATFLSFVFAPLNGWLRKKKVHISLVMLIMLIIISLLMVGAFMLLNAAAGSLISGFPRYQYRLVLELQNWIEFFENWNIKLASATSSLPKMDISRLLSPGSFSLSKTLSNVMSTTVGIGWNFILIIIFLMFIVAQDGRLSERLAAVLKEEDRIKTTKTLHNIQVQIQRYLLTKTVISLLTAIVGMVFMALYGVDFILVCGILLFVLNFIPNIGSIIASGIPILICFLQGGLDWRTITFSMCIIGTQMLFGNIIEPQIQGERLDLSPIMVLVSLIFWGWVWGIVGMLLAVPITSAINIMLKQINEKNLISAIISA